MANDPNNYPGHVLIGLVLIGIGILLIGAAIAMCEIAWENRRNRLRRQEYHMLTRDSGVIGCRRRLTGPEVEGEGTGYPRAGKMISDAHADNYAEKWRKRYD